MLQADRFRSIPAYFFILLLAICAGGSPAAYNASHSGRMITASQSSAKLQVVTNVDDSTLIVKHCSDFGITGDGANAEWNKTVWHSLTKLDHFGPDYPGRFKILYSDSGIYVLFTGEDHRITTNALQDMSEIYEGDAFEVFMLPDTARGVYFEYEISPIGKQLVLALVKAGKNRSAWLPWSKSPGRLDRRVKVAGGSMLPGAVISGWTAELFFSYEVLNLVSGKPPVPGNVWRANLCRLDYDNGHPPVKWSWSPGITSSFHELEQFRRLQFE